MNLSGCLGLLNPIKWVESAVKYFRRPRFKIYFDPEETFHTRRLVDLDNAPGFFCHLMVKNVGKEVAKECRAHLIEVKVRNDDGIFLRHPDFLNPVVLKWAHEPDFGPRDIDPDIPKRLDLCMAVQPYPQFFSFFTQRVPTGNRIDYPPGDYLVRVRVRAENSSSSDNSFFITYRGVWNQFVIRELVAV